MVPQLHPLLIQFAEKHGGLLIKIKPDMWMAEDGHFAVRYSDDYGYFGPPEVEQTRLEHLILFQEKRLEQAETLHRFLYAVSGNPAAVPAGLDWNEHTLGKMPETRNERGHKQTPEILLNHLAQIMVTVTVRLRKLQRQYNKLPAVMRLNKHREHLERLTRNPQSLHKTPEPQYDWSLTNDR